MSARDKIRKYVETEKTNPASKDAQPEKPAGDTSDQNASSGDEPEALSDGPEAQQPPDDEASRIAAAESKANENYERFVRTAAELENFRKRSEREKDDLRKYAVEKMARDLLPVVDNLERALNTPEVGQASEALLKGVQMVYQELLKVLANHQIVPFESLNLPFDPQYHQAIMQEVSAEHPANTVIQEYQKGYTIHGRLCRPAMVVVSQSAGEDDGNTESKVDDPKKND